MKKDIHPEYYKDAKIICSCGAVLSTGATQKELHVEICSACHPFYTGKKKVLDTTGRVDRFKKLAEKAAAKKKTGKTGKQVKKTESKESKKSTKK
jgi:large subunit ribosomal protein L31